MSKQSKSAQIVVRLEPDLRALVENAAAIERRPVANFVRNVLAERLAPVATAEGARDAA